MGEAKVSSRLAQWIKPGDGIWTDTVELLKTRDGKKDALDAAVNVCDWMHHLGYHKEFVDTIRKDLEPVSKAFAIPEFVVSLGELRDKWLIFNHTDDKAGPAVDLVGGLANTTHSLSESALAGDAWGLYELGEGMKSTQTAFWGSLSVMMGIRFIRESETLRVLKNDIKAITNEVVKNLYEHKIQNGYLRVLKVVVLLAMSAIALTSLLFASIAHGFLFSSVAFMTLSSAWLILNYTTYFYGKMIGRWDAEINSIAAPSGAARV